MNERITHLTERPTAPVESSIFRRTPILFLAVGFLLLIGIVIGVALFAVGVRDNTMQVDRRFRMIIELNEILSSLQDAETGQRGYLITRDDNYLGPYRAGVESLSGRLVGLAAAAQGDTAAIAEIGTLTDVVRHKLAELTETIDLARAGRQAEAMAIVRSDSGRGLMDEARRIIGEMRTREVAARAEAFAAASRGANLLQVGVAAAAVLIVIVGGFAIGDARRRHRALALQAQAIEEQYRLLQDTNRQLKDEVEIRHAAEDQLRQVQKIEAVGQLTGGIAHDFNNMLAVIISALNLMQRRFKANDYDVGKFLDAASDAARRAADLTQRLLAFSRQQPLAPQAVDANRLVAGMSELLRRTLGETIELETVLAGGLWRVHADPSQLENSILNLAVNARDAMAEGGRITIETANCHLDDVYVRDNPAAKAGQYVLIAVTDTGSGMPPEIVGKAFDPFFTTKGVGKGTGLGLSQVYGFIKQTGGHIKIYSEVGEGTAVKLYLPRSLGEGVADLPAARSTVGSPVGDNEVILVVEDEERVRGLAVASLTELGYTPVAADSGAAALKLIEAHPEIVLLFTDIVMPDMNGRKLAELAVERRPDLKVLFTTGFTRNAVVHNGILDPGVNFLAKPFTLEQLAMKIRWVIDS